MSKIMVIGIAGGTGSGKTTITRRLIERFGGDVSVIHHDNYYKAHHDMPYEERALLNYDHPDAFDTDMLIEHLKLLKQGQSVQCPVYDYSIHDRTDKTITIRPTRVIVVEGILIYENKELCDQMDIKIFVDADDDDRLMRVMARDIRERGKNVEWVIERYSRTVKPMYLQFIEPSKRFADIIIPQGGHNKVGISVILNTVEKALRESKKEAR